MQNYIGSADNLTIVAPVDVTSGTLYVDKALIFIAMGDALTGEKVAACTRGEFELPAVDGVAADLGDIAFWDQGNNEVTPTSSAAHVEIGVFSAAKASGDTEARVLLTGQLGKTQAGAEPPAES